MSVEIDKINIAINKLSKNNKERLLTILEKLPFEN